MAIINQYIQRVASGELIDDSHQLDAARALQRVLQELEQQPRRHWLALKRPSVPGLYLWGGVGRGKTRLMDIFYDHLRLERKKRIHFHRFMRDIHEGLKLIRDTRDPLARIGKDLARNHRIICLDEFLVKDIGDAIILAGLLRAMLDAGATLVMTSNTEPGELYRGGLQRQRFLPAIDLIKTHCEVVCIGDGTDYRLRSIAGKRLYFTPLNERSSNDMQREFENLSANESEITGPIEVLNREIATIRRTRNLVWFEFSDICDGPRANADYIEIANCYRTVMISNIPALTWEYENQARRFIELVDEFYDRGVHLVASAALEPDRLYCGTRLTQDFLRTASRLIEMQTEPYLAKAHCL